MNASSVLLSTITNLTRVNFDTKRLPLLKGNLPINLANTFFVAIDNFSRELYTDIFPHKTQISAACFLIDTVIAQCSYRIDYAYSDNSKEFKGTNDHAFVKACRQHGIVSEVYSHQSPANQR